MNKAGPSRPPLSPSKSSPRLQRDIWGLGLSSDLPPTSPSSHNDRPNFLRRRSGPISPSKSNQHPLHRIDSPPGDNYEVLSDVSRPSLTRLTSDLERRAGSSRGSEDGSHRGSMDRLRMTSGSGEAKEVEVLVHQVQANESLAGIALLYGIDLATLRKTNKLWPSDPVHLRRHLYVPLDACKWNKASETLIRGPGEGQVTLSPKTPSKGKERERRETANLIDLGDAVEQSPSQLSDETVDPWGSFSPMASFAPLVDHPAQTLPHPAAESPPPPGRIADIVRIPSSQLRFFPKPPRPPDSARTSFDSGPRPTLPPPLSIQNDLHFSHQPVISRKSSTSSFGTVRLRPPSSSPSNGTSLADRMANLFYIPPPPPEGFSVPPPKGRPRKSLDSSRSSQKGSKIGSPTFSPARPVEEVEMMMRIRKGAEAQTKVGDRRKLD